MYEELDGEPLEDGDISMTQIYPDDNLADIPLTQPEKDLAIEELLNEFVDVISDDEPHPDACGSAEVVPDLCGLCVQGACVYRVCYDLRLHLFGPFPPLYAMARPWTLQTPC